MLGILTSELLQIDYYLRHPWLLLILGFQIWMLVDAIRRQEWFWAVFIFIFPLFNALLYYFLVYRPQRASAPARLELPGSHARKRIKELEAQIHHLDKAHHHAELGDIYFEQTKLDQAEKCYRAAVEREPGDPDYQARLGLCLLRKGRAQEARPLLEQVALTNPRHDYGQTMMAYAEALTELGEPGPAETAWKKVLEEHGYARARVQLAELYLKRGERELARNELKEVIEDDAHTAAFQRKQEKAWVKRAKELIKKTG